MDRIIYRAMLFIKKLPIFIVQYFYVYAFYVAKTIAKLLRIIFKGAIFQNMRGWSNDREYS